MSDETDELARLRLYNEASQVFHRDNAETLMRLLPTSQWQDVATAAQLADVRTELDEVRAGLAEVRAEVADVWAEVAGIRAQMVTRAELRVELDRIRSRMATKDEVAVGFAQMNAKLERSSRQLVVWLAGVLAALASVQTALFVSLS